MLLSVDNSKVLHHSSAVKVVLLRLDPETPVYESEKLSLEQVHLLQKDSADVGNEVVAVEDVIEELG